MPARPSPSPGSLARSSSSEWFTHVPQRKHTTLLLLLVGRSLAAAAGAAATLLLVPKGACVRACGWCMRVPQGAIIRAECIRTITHTRAQKVHSQNECVRVRARICYKTCNGQQESRA